MSLSQRLIVPRLIQIRQQITAVETIKKITHAMRLISMSSHSRMRGLQEPLATYTNLINSFFSRILQYAPDWTHPLMSPDQNTPALIIAVGSQKSLCGSFNVNLMHYLQSTINAINLKHARALNFTNNPTNQTNQTNPNNTPNINNQNNIRNISNTGYAYQAGNINTTVPYHLIVIGQRLIEMVNESNMVIHSTHPQFSQLNLNSLTHTLSDLISHTVPTYQSATIICNTGKSFFLQRPHSVQLVPLIPKTAPISSTSSTRPDIGNHPDAQEYLWYHSAEQILSKLIDQYLEAHIYHTLFESLLAEHAARFISMDSSTRNAQSLLDKAKSEYNKVRQAKITKELNELTSSYSS